MSTCILNAHLAFYTFLQFRVQTTEWCWTPMGWTYPHQFRQARQYPQSQPDLDKSWVRFSPQVIVGAAKLTIRNNHHTTLSRQESLAMPHVRNQEFKLQLFKFWLWNLGEWGVYSTTQLLGRPMSVTDDNMFEEMSHFLATLAMTSVDNIIWWYYHSVWYVLVTMEFWGHTGHFTTALSVKGKSLSN